MSLILEVTAVHLGEIEDDTYIFLTIGAIWLTYNLHFIYRAWILRVTDRDLRSRGLNNREHNHGDSLSRLIRNEDKRNASSLKPVPSSRRMRPQKYQNPITLAVQQTSAAQEFKDGNKGAALAT